MPTTYTHAQIERFKREAKNVSRAGSLTHSQALDQIASAHGWKNWSLLMKHSQQTEDGGRSWLRFTRTQEEMRQALRVIKQPGLGSSRSDAALRVVDDINGQFASARNAVAFAIEYMECLLSVPRYRVTFSSPVYWELRCWLPYGAIGRTNGGQVLVNRRYKPVGSTTGDFVDYDDFSHLALQLSPEQLQAFAHKPDAAGFAFGDGCAPWDSRTDGEAYLARLHKLKVTLES